MRPDVVRQVQRERNSWMKQCRRELVEQLIRQHGPRRAGLQLLEVGAGLGQNIPTLRRFGAVDAIEADTTSLEQLQQQAALRQLYPQTVPFALDRHYDVICGLELLEHIVDDSAALAWMHDHLLPGGIVVLTVPAYPWLFSEHDRALGHHRRYTRRSLLSALPTGLEVVACGYYNMLLFPAQVAQVAARSITRLGRPAGASCHQQGVGCTASPVADVSRSTSLRARRGAANAGRCRPGPGP